MHLGYPVERTEGVPELFHKLPTDFIMVLKRNLTKLVQLGELAARRGPGALYDVLHDVHAQKRVLHAVVGHLRPLHGLRDISRGL